MTLFRRQADNIYFALEQEYKEKTRCLLPYTHLSVRVFVQNYPDLTQFMIAGRTSVTING